MKNVMVIRYGKGKSITERIALSRLWDEIQSKVVNELGEGALPLQVYAVTGLRFVREMRNSEVPEQDQISTGS